MPRLLGRTLKGVRSRRSVNDGWHEICTSFIQVVILWRFPSMFAARPAVIVGLILAWVLLVRLKNASATDATPPKQPERGPGGKEYAHKATRQKSYGEGDTQY